MMGSYGTTSKSEDCPSFSAAAARARWIGATGVTTPSVFMIPMRIFRSG